MSSIFILSLRHILVNGHLSTAKKRVAEERRAQNKDAMRKEEFEALVGLGRQIRV